MKILSIYLPGFHEDDVNNEAWGKGFTEWDNVRSGKPLFDNHYQPLVPLNNNYYDLSDSKVLESQSLLAKKYGVDGFIFYHYWFGNGNMALEKPISLYKDNPNRIEYAICWANHSWIKNWHDGDSKVIRKQIYGSEEEWLSHIEYLYEFFKDEKYIKIDNRPVLYIYNLSDIKDADKMINYWNKWLNAKGMSNVYIVEYISSRNKKAHLISDSVVEFEPLYATFFDISPIKLAKRFIIKKLNKLDFQDYDYIWKKIINRKRLYGDLPIQKGCFSNWDNSARKGHLSMIMKNSSPKKFGYYFEKLYLSKRKNTNDFIVINAWNEWSEGAILEPTEKDKYGYLEEIKRVRDKYE